MFKDLNHGSFFVMAGLDPAIHVFVLRRYRQDVDTRDKRGHDEFETRIINGILNQTFKRSHQSRMRCHSARVA
jgi:hypothetical protein